jgi:hypothetical protein
MINIGNFPIEAPKVLLKAPKEPLVSCLWQLRPGTGHSSLVSY